MSRKILLADDSLTIQKVVELTFMEGDYEVIAASNGDEALQRLAEVSPDIVIADVHMPGADGYEICRRAKEADARIPVLLLVGTFEPFEEDAAQQVGAEAHLKKPFDSQELLRLVEELLTASAAWQAPPAIEPEAVGEESFLEESAAAAVEPPTIEDVFESYSESGDEIAAPVASEVASPPAGLSAEDVDRIARRVVELMSEETVREISWDVIPDLAEILIKDRIREIENQVE